MGPAERAKGGGLCWLSCAMAMVAATMVLFVFTHPRCFTAAKTNDHVPYFLFGVWCLAELLALLAMFLGLVSLIMMRGRSLPSWFGAAISMLVLVGAIVYPVVFLLTGVAEQLSKPGFHGFGK